MERTVMADLVAWKNAPNRKPLVLFGARQVGKTWLLRELGRTQYHRVVYVSLDESSLGRRIFEPDLDPGRILADLAVLDGGPSIDPADTLIVLDEVQESPRALTSLKHFAENAPDYHLACAGSLLGVAAHPDTSFPVGKVNIINVHPLTFTEFLAALGEDGLATMLRDDDLARLEPFHDKLVSYLRWYLFVGGMPEVVAQFIPRRDTLVVRDLQRELIAGYDSDFSKHAPLTEVPRLRGLFDSIPRQLAKENKRFVYGQAQPGARAKTLELALQWLLDAGLVHRVRRVQTPRLPLSAYADDTAFKLFLLDTGLIGAMADLDPRTIVDPDALFAEFKGALTEQYVLQSLIAAAVTPYYWTNKTGAAEIDFILQAGAAPIPLEVKAGISRQAKSLRFYRDTYSPPVCLRATLRPYHKEDWLINLPLYVVGRVPDLLASCATTQSSELACTLPN